MCKLSSHRSLLMVLVQIQDALQDALQLKVTDPYVLELAEVADHLKHVVDTLRGALDALETKAVARAKGYPNP